MVHFRKSILQIFLYLFMKKAYKLSAVCYFFKYLDFFSMYSLWKKYLMDVIVYFKRNCLKFIKISTFFTFLYSLFNEQQHLICLILLSIFIFYLFIFLKFFSTFVFPLSKLRKINIFPKVKKTCFNQQFLKLFSLVAI